MARPLTGEQMAVLAGVSGGAIAKAKHSDDPLHRQAGGYDAIEVGRWLARRTLAAAGRTEGDVLDLAHEQTLLARQRRITLEHEHAIAKGRYVEKARVIESFQRAGMTFRDAMLSVPGRVASQLASTTDERDIDRRLTAEIRAELERLADSAAAYRGDA